MLNLGSSTRSSRKAIERELFAILAAAGVEVVHADLKAGEGVDVVGDVLDPEVRRQLAARGFRCVLAANLLEHVRDPAEVAAACEDIVGAGGLILATVPASYPYHADPIDTGFRPDPDALAALFARSTRLIAEEVIGGSYRDEIAARGAPVAGDLARTLLLGLVAPLRPKAFRARLDRWRWYRRRYRVAIALVRTGIIPPP